MLTIRDYNPSEKLPAGFLDIYAEAFPAEERRNWRNNEDIKAFMSAHPDMKIRLLTDNYKVLGLMVYWFITDNVCYIEHLAISKELRNGGYGSTLINSLKDTPGIEIILEVEPPTDTLTCRRIDFYNRHGLILHKDISYIQPPYTPDLPEVELCIMATPGLSSTLLTTTIIPQLKQLVYSIL